MITWHRSESRHDWSQPSSDTRIDAGNTYVNLLREGGDHFVVERIERFGPVELVYSSEALRAVLDRELSSAFPPG